MEWSLILEIILKAVGSLLGTLLVAFASVLFAKLKTKIFESRVIKFIAEVVKAAEQLYPNEGKKMGPEKYEYVSKTVLAKFPTITDNNYLRALIEGAVYSLNDINNKVIEKIEQKPAETIKTDNDVLSSF